MILSAHKEQAFDGKTYDPLFDRKRLDNQHLIKSSTLRLIAEPSYIMDG
jgi:hypothetical protein